MNMIRDALETHNKIVVVGLSPNAERPSHYVTEYMMKRGYEICGVNPGHSSILGRPCYPSLKEVPGSLEIVNVFRSSEYIPQLVDELIELQQKHSKTTQVLWLQAGITHAEAEEKARKAGITVISDRCIMVEHRQLDSKAS